MKKLLLSAFAASLLCFSGCGTMFHSNRIGQRMSTVIDNSVWYGNIFLGLFGIIPAVVGFVLDYHNETIYYTEAELIPDDEPLGMIRTDGDMSCENVARLLSARLHRTITAEQVRRSLILPAL